MPNSTPLSVIYMHFALGERARENSDYAISTGWKEKEKGKGRKG